jgi:DNA polymerase-3 subunit epsilon
MKKLLAVVDLETTGLGKSDRIVEVAVVLIDAQSFEVVDEYETLVNPLRDIGPTHIHGVTAQMVEAAPTFGDISGYLGRLIDGHILVAHNLPFDSRFLHQEFDQLSLAFDPGKGIDTLRLTGEKLSTACERFGIPHPHQHWALSDARVTAELLRAIHPDIDALPAAISYSEYGIPRTLPRDHGNRGSTVGSTTRLPTSEPAELAYLDILDRFLEDRMLDEDELDALGDLADSLGIPRHMQPALHLDYFNAFVSGAMRDGLITPGENEHLQELATTLGISAEVVPAVTKTAKLTALAGLRVCFTGTATLDRRPVERRELERLAANYGLQPVGSVTQKGCDLVVAADSTSMSGKAKKARDWGIPVMSVQDFLQKLTGS